MGYGLKVYHVIQKKFLRTLHAILFTAPLYCSKTSSYVTVLTNVDDMLICTKFSYTFSGSLHFNI